MDVVKDRLEEELVSQSLSLANIGMGGEGRYL
jgi:hypothetical protein